MRSSFLVGLTRTHSTVICNTLTDCQNERKDRCRRCNAHTGKRDLHSGELNNQETNQQYPGSLLSYRIFQASSQGGCSLPDPVIKDRRNRRLPQLKPCMMLPGHPVQYLRAGTRQRTWLTQSSDRGRWRRSLHAKLTWPELNWRFAVGAKWVRFVVFHLSWRMYSLKRVPGSFCFHFRTKSGG